MKYVKLYEEFVSAEQKELDQIQAWLADTTEEMEDFEWDGQTLTVYLKDKPLETYTREDLEEAGVFNSEIVEKVSKDAQEYISSKISKLRDEGVEQDQAVAMAYSYAKKKGYRIPDVDEKEKGLLKKENK